MDAWFNLFPIVCSKRNKWQTALILQIAYFEVLEAVADGYGRLDLW